jgi:predicted RNase H-like HicB family nuclease
MKNTFLMTLEAEQEVDGRWIVDVLELPGVMVYGSSKEDALAKAEVLALRVVADRIEHEELPLGSVEIRFAAA